MGPAGLGRGLPLGFLRRPGATVEGSGDSEHLATQPDRTGIGDRPVRIVHPFVVQTGVA